MQTIGNHRQVKEIKKSASIRFLRRKLGKAVAFFFCFFKLAASSGQLVVAGLEGNPSSFCWGLLAR